MCMKFIPGVMDSESKVQGLKRLTSMITLHASQRAQVAVKTADKSGYSSHGFQTHRVMIILLAEEAVHENA